MKVFLYWISAILFLRPVFGQCVDSDSASIQVGSYSQEIQDAIGSFCQNVPVILDSNSQNLRHIATFSKMEQFIGVMFGIKSFEVSSYYVQEKHQLSLISSFYDKFEWKIVQINYLITSDTSIFFGTYIIEAWNHIDCQENEIMNQQKTTELMLPGGQKNKVVVMLKGLNCPTQQCGISNLNWAIENQILKIDYNFTLKYDLTSKHFPLKAHLIYIVIQENFPISFEFIQNVEHTFQSIHDRPFNNYFTDTEAEKINNDRENFYFIGLSEVKVVLNTYSILKLNLCQKTGASLRKEDKIMKQNCGIHEVLINNECQCQDNYSRDRLSQECQKNNVGLCPKNQYFNVNACTQCQDNCKECSQKGICQLCEENYGLWKIGSNNYCFEL